MNVSFTEEVFIMKREITYMEHEGYQYPNLTLPEQEDVVIGRFGQRHKRYLKKSRRLVYFRLLTSGKLSSYCRGGSTGAGYV